MFVNLSLVSIVPWNAITTCTVLPVIAQLSRTEIQKILLKIPIQKILLKMSLSVWEPLHLQHTICGYLHLRCRYHTTSDYHSVAYI